MSGRKKGVAASKTRSGGRYGLPVEEDDQEEDLARGTLRTGSLYRRSARGHYASLAALKKAHERLFSQDAVFWIAELPVVGGYKGIAQGVLRVRADASDSFKTSSLEKAYTLFTEKYPGQTAYVTLTANVILRSREHTSYSIYFGQSFGNAKTVYYGQEHDDRGEIRRLFSEYVVSDTSDLAQLPKKFTTEDFSGIYKRNFARSNVAVHRVVSLIYFFSVGLENYEKNRQLTQRTPLRLF